MKNVFYQLLFLSVIAIFVSACHGTINSERLQE